MTRYANVTEVSLDDTIFGCVLSAVPRDRDVRDVLARRAGYYGSLKLGSVDFSAVPCKGGGLVVHARFHFSADDIVRVAVDREGSVAAGGIPPLAIPDSDPVVRDAMTGPVSDEVRSMAKEAFSAPNARARAAVLARMSEPRFREEARGAWVDGRRKQVHEKLRTLAAQIDADIMHTFVDELYVSEVLRS